MAPALAVGVTIDLSVTSTLAVYFFGVRRGRVDARWLWRVFAAGLLIARLVLPAENRGLVTFFRVAAIPLELGAMVLLIRRGGFLGRLFAAEGAILYYALIAWLVPPRALEGERFSIHKRGTWRGVALVFGFLIVVESAATHLLVAHWSPTAAWILSGLGAYSLLWLWGDWQALRRKTPRVTASELVIELGLRARAVIPLALIESAGPPDERRDHLQLGLDRAPSVVVRLREPVEVRGFLGRRRQARALGFTVDEPERLLAALK